MTATMMIAARQALGMYLKLRAMLSIAMMTMMAAMTPLNCDLAPVVSFTAVREKLPVTGNDWKNDEIKSASPSATSSCEWWIYCAI